MGTVLSSCARFVGKFAYGYDILLRENLEKYSKLILDEISIGDIMLTSVDGHLSNVFISDDYTHATVYLGYGIIENGKMVQHSDKEKYPIFIESTGDRGVHLISLEHLIINKDAILILKNTLIKPEQIPAFVEKLESFLGKPYDYVFSGKNDKYYCSEIITDTLVHILGKEEFKIKMGTKSIYKPSHYQNVLFYQYELRLLRDFELKEEKS
jgi:hypothetical protein